MAGARVSPGGTVLIPDVYFSVHFVSAVNNTWVFEVTGIEGTTPHGLSNWGFLCEPGPEVLEGSLVIHKVVQDAEGTVMENNDTIFTFQIWEDDELIEEEISVSVSNPATFALPAGEYTIKEVDIPAGYTAEEEEQTVRLIAGQDSQVTFVNIVDDVIIIPVDDEGILIIEKVVRDEEGTEITDDTTEFTFEIRFEDKVIETGTAAVNKPFSINLPVGTYAIVEINIPDGYTVTENDLPAVIEVDSTTTVTFTNTVEDDVIIIPPPPPLVGAPSVSIAKTGPETAEPGDTVTYEFTVTNNGNVDLEDVVVTDPMLNLTHEIGDMEPGEIVVFTADYVIPADFDDEELENIAFVTGKYGNEEVTDEDNHVIKIDVDEVTIITPETPGVGDDDEDEVTIITPETPGVGDDDEDEAEELPRTGTADMLLFTLGAALTAGGFVVRRRRK